MSIKRRVLFIALPLAVVVGVVAALFLQKHAGLGGGAGAADNAPGATRTAAGGADDSTSANGSGASATASKRRPGGSAATDDGADAEDVGGTEPVWGVRISGLPQGDDLYALDVDGKWLADPKNPTRSPLSSLGRMYSSNGLLGFNSLLRWPVPDAQPPESVRIASPTSAEFRYTGRIRQAVVYRSPERDADWGTDEMKPRNAGARANLDAILADPMLGHVQGAVLDAERRAIAGARVQVTWMPTAAVTSYRPAKRTVVTAEDGRFSIDRLDLGPGTLLVRAAGHPMSRATPVRIGRGEGTPIEVVLEAGVIVSGSVTNAAGKPVAGAIVTVRFASNSTGGRTRANPPPPVITNAAGLFTITSLAPGTYDIAATAEGLGDALRRSVSFVIGEAPAAIDLVLADGLALRGRVVRKQGAEDVGVPRAYVVAYPNQRNRSRAASYSPHFAVSDAKGDFVVTGLVPNVEIYVMASQGLAQATKQEQVTLTEGAAPPSVELRLPEAGRIAGRVVLPSGAPVSGVQVAPAGMSQGGGYSEMAYFREFLGDSFPQAVTGPDGAFALSGLPLTSAFTVEARGEGYAPARAENVSCNSPNETLLTLIKGGKITGHVVEKTGDRPLAQMRVSLTPGGDNNYGGPGSDIPSAITDAAGAFSFDLLRPATYQAEAQGLVPGSDGSERWYFAVGSDDLEVRADASASVVLKASPGGTLRGKVLTQGTDQPVEGASVSANLQQGRGRVGRFGMARNMMGGGQFWTQAEGVFEIPDLTPGFYNLGASKEGFFFSGNPQEKNTVVRPGESTDNVIVRLGQGGIVRGIVLDPDAQPVPDASLQIRRAKPVSGQGSGRYVNMGDGGYFDPGYGGSGGGTVGSATSGADGRFECVGLDPSASPLRVATTTGAGPDGAWVGESDDVTITSGTLLAEVTLRLTVGGSISGRVLDENEKPLEGVRLSLMRQSNEGSRSYGGSDTGVRTNAAGEYTAGGLTAGNYTLSANKEGYSSEQRDNLAVADGQPTPGIDLKLSKGRPITGSVVDPAGVGLAGWSVSANSNSPGMNRGGSNVTTDSDGKFTIQSGLTGTVRFNLNMNRSTRPGKQGYSSYTSGDVELPEGEVKDPITLTLVSHTVKGRIVLTGSKKPVAGVDVMVNVNSRNGTSEAEGTQCVSQNANLTAREKTGEDGVFVIETVPNGMHNFSLEGKGFVRKDSINMELEGTGVLDAGDIEVEAARSITARLLDASTRQPYQPTQATDNVQIRTSDDLSENSSSTGVTLDEDGRFTLDKAAPATTRLTVSAGGYQPLDVADIKLRDDGPTDLGDLLLEQGCTLAGFFYDVAEGKPLSRVQGPYGQQRFNVQVEIQDANGKARSANGFRFEGDEGKFEVRGVSRDIQSAKFTFQSDQFLPVKITAIPTPDGAGRMDLGRVDLASGGVILGIVVDAKDVPCPNAQAMVSTQPAPPPKPGEPPAPNRNQQTIQRYSQTDGEGKFRAAALSDGQYRVSVTARGFAPAVQSDVAVTSGGQATRVRIVVSPGTKLAGTLTDLGTHILSKWQVNAQAAGSDGNSYGGGNSAQTDTLGHFELADVPNGSARLSFNYNQQTKKGNSSMSFRSAPLDPSGDEVVFILPLGPEIKGRLVDESGAGIPGARIAVSQNGGNRGGGNPGATPDKPEDGCSLQNLNLTVESATDESGRFKIGPVAVGSAQITISGEMMSKKNLDKIVIGVDDEHDLGDVTVQGAGVLVGRFVDKVTGAPAHISENDSMNCMIRRTNGGDGVNFKAKGPDASFRVGGIPADAVSVTFSVSRYLPCQIKEPKVTVGNETDLGDVVLDPGVTLRFKLTDAATGQPYGGNNTGVQISGQRQGGVADTPGGGPGSDSWSSGGQSKDDGICLIRPAPSDLSQVTIRPSGCEAIVIDSIPLPDSKGLVDLGERKVTRKAGPNGQ